MKKKLKRNFPAYDDLEILSEYRKSREDENYDPEDKKVLEAEYKRRLADARARNAAAILRKDMMLAENHA